MITNALFRQCLAEIPEEVKAEFDLSFGIADRLNALLKEKGISQRELANRMGKRESEVSKWLTGRHNFTMRTIAQISAVLNAPLIEVAR